MMESAINRFLGIEEQDLPDGRSLLKLRVRPEFLNELGIPHGGIPSLLLDGVMGRTMVRALSPGETAATVQFSVQFLQAATGTLTAEATILRRGRSAAFIQGFCRNEKGELVAQAHGTWSIRRYTSQASIPRKSP